MTAISAPAAPAAPTATPSTTPAVPVASAVTAPIVPLRTVVAHARGIIPRRVVARSKILRRRSVRFRLAFVHLVDFGRRAFSSDIAVRPFHRFVNFLVPAVFFAVAVLFVRLVQRNGLFVDGPAAAAFTGQ